MRKIIILSKTDRKDFFDVGYVFWLLVPFTMQPMIVNPNATSVIKDITTAELDDIKQGKVKEETGVLPFANGTLVGTIGSKLVQLYNSSQSILDNTIEFKHYGTYWDGTNSTIQGA